MKPFIICLPTYGKEPKQDPLTGKKVSTLKCGASGNTAEILMALYGQNARDLSTPRQSYRYLALDPLPELRHNYLTLQITASQLVSVETVCKKHPYARAFLWRNDQWWLFPNQENQDYGYVSHSAPPFTPNATVINPVNAQTEQVVPVTSFSPAPLTEEKSAETQPLHVPQEMTYVAIATRGMEPDIYREHGKAMPALVCSENTSTLLSKLLGSRVRPLQSDRLLNHYLCLEVVPVLPENYLLFQLTPDEVLVVEEVCRQQAFPRAFRWWLDTWWEFPGVAEPHYTSTQNLHQAVPKFNPEKHAQYALTTGKTLPPIPEPSAQKPSLSGLLLEKDRATWWIKGDTYPHRKTLQTAGARWWRSGGCWYVTGDLPECIQALIDPDILDKLLPPKPETVPGPEPKAPQMVVTSEALKTCTPPEKSAAEEDLTPAHPALPVSLSSSQGHYQPPQKYLGSVTGRAGEVFAFGAALHQETLMYLDVVGSKTAVESVWAQLDLGRSLKIISLEHKTEIPLPGQKGMFKRFQRALITGAEHLVLLHKEAVEVEYPVTAQTLVFYASQEQAVARMAYHLTQLVTVPVFPAWYDYLWEQGRSLKLITPCRCIGVSTPYCFHLSLFRDRWTDLIRSGLKSGILQLPA